jgi:hypothetical protein
MWPDIETPNYSLTFEEHWFGPIAHMTVHTRWTASLRREVRDLLDRLVALRGPIHVAHYPEQGALQRHFLALMGFTPHCRRKDCRGDWVNFYIKLR